MAIGDTTITIVGNLVDDPELKLSEQGTVIAAFTVASTRRVLNKATGKMADGDTVFMRCSAFRELAEHIAESASKEPACWSLDVSSSAAMRTSRGSNGGSSRLSSKTLVSR